MKWAGRVDHRRAGLAGACSILPSSPPRRSVSLIRQVASELGSLRRPSACKGINSADRPEDGAAARFVA